MPVCSSNSVHQGAHCAMDVFLSQCTEFTTEALAGSKIMYL